MLPFCPPSHVTPSNSPGIGSTHETGGLNGPRAMIGAPLQSLTWSLQNTGCLWNPLSFQFFHAYVTVRDPAASSATRMSWRCVTPFSSRVR